MLRQISTSFGLWFVSFRYEFAGPDGKQRFDAKVNQLSAKAFKAKLKSNMVEFESINTEIATLKEVFEKYSTQASSISTNSSTSKVVVISNIDSLGRPISFAAPKPDSADLGADKGTCSCLLVVFLQVHVFCMLIDEKKSKKKKIANKMDADGHRVAYLDGTLNLNTDFAQVTCLSLADLKKTDLRSMVQEVSI